MANTEKPNALNCQINSLSPSSFAINYDTFPSAVTGDTALIFVPGTIGGVRQPGYYCTTITDVSNSNSLIETINIYNNCYECYTANTAIVVARDCLGNYEENFYFNITDFGFIPDNPKYTVYNLNFVSPRIGGIISGCFGLYVAVPPPDFDFNQLPISTLIQPPSGYTSTTELTPCQECVNNSQKVYQVVRCCVSEECPQIFDYIYLLDDSYNGHTITYSDLNGIDRYCGIVIGQVDLIPPITGIFVSDYSPNNNQEICDSCNDSVNDKRIIYNCLNPDQTEVVWNSPYFTTGDFSHLSTNLGCYNLGPLTTSAITRSDFLNFDPQPSCQDCIQCNGVILTLTTNCPPNQLSPSYNVLSYQYAEIGDVIWDPYNQLCATVLNVSNDTTQRYNYVFYSFLTLGIDCNVCYPEPAEFIRPISYYARECGNVSDIPSLVITFDSTSTITTGDIVKAKWGTSDFLCYEILDPYYGDISSIYVIYDFYYSDTVTPFDSCTGCTTTGRLGVTLVNCNTYVEKYVNVDLDTWVTMTGYDDGLGSHVVKGNDGQCYYLINNCPISTANTETFTTNEFYYYCFQCTPDNQTSCKCYYGIGTSASTVTGTYLDCTGGTRSFYSDSGFTSFCGTLIDGNNIFDSGRACTENKCPDFCCQCYDIKNNNDSLLYIRYLDCDGNFVNLSIEAHTKASICALNIQYLTSLALYTPTVPEGVVQIVDTYQTLQLACVNRCQLELSVKEKLLYGIKSKFEPCPSDCCGKNKNLISNLLKGNGNTPGTYSIR